MNSLFKKLCCISAKLLLINTNQWERLRLFLVCFSTLKYSARKAKTPVIPYHWYQQWPSKIKSCYILYMRVLYILHTVQMYSYIKFSYRHTFKVVFVRCLLHCQQEASTWKVRICLAQNSYASLASHIILFLFPRELKSAPWQCPWKRGHLLQQFKRGQTLLKAHRVQGVASHRCHGLAGVKSTGV